MDLKTEKLIDLTAYGATGEVVMSAPTLRRTIDMKNEMGKGARIIRKGGSVTMEDAPQGDMEILGILTYVEKAPFKRTVESFLTFCDELDANDRGSASRLFDDMAIAAYELDQGGASPLED